MGFITINQPTIWDNMFGSLVLTLVFQNPLVIPCEEVFGTPKGRTLGDVWGSKHLFRRYLED